MAAADDHFGAGRVHQSGAVRATCPGSLRNPKGGKNKWMLLWMVFSGLLD